MTDSVLIIAAHPDDEVLGCGGTIARLVEEGHEVNIAILGEGITSRFPQGGPSETTLVEALRVCSQKVAALLGARSVFHYNLPDNGFDTVPLLNIVKIIEELSEKVNPQVVYTHSGADLNIDHSIVLRAALTATRPMQGQSVRSIYSFEVPSSTEWAFGQFQTAFRPNVFVNISSSLQAKVAAMALYRSETRCFPHPRSAEAIRAIAQRWGSTIGYDAAEAFELVRSIHLS